MTKSGMAAGRIRDTAFFFTHIDFTF